MPTTTKSATILLVSRNPSVIEATRTSLAKEETFNLLDKEVTSQNLFQIIAEALPDLILLDFENQHQPYYLVYKITTEYPQCTIVAILSESKLKYSDHALQLGARAFILYPYQSNNLVITIKRLMEPKEHIQMDTSQTPNMDSNASLQKTFTVFSPKGGAGCTTIATNLAISLHKTLKEDVLLIDGKHLFGHVALYLNLLTGNSIADLIAHAGMLDHQLINQVVLQHRSGIHVLPSPNSITEAEEIRPESLFMVIQSLQEVFPNIIIDGGNNLDENTVTYLDSSDKILLVLNPDLASMRDVRQFMEISTSLSYPDDKTLFILNLVGRKIEMKSEEIEKILKIELFGKIPADENIALSSLNEGVPILLKKPHHPISKAYSKTTKALVKMLQTSKTE